jgi:hypothetical protein
MRAAIAGVVMLFFATLDIPVCIVLDDSSRH